MSNQPEWGTPEWELWLMEHDFDDEKPLTREQVLAAYNFEPVPPPPPVTVTRIERVVITKARHFDDITQLIFKWICIVAGTCFLLNLLWGR